MSAPPLEVRGLGHSYGTARALLDVTLRFDAGVVHALIGRNGAGKTTLLRALSGALAPQEGELLLDGSVARLRSPHDALSRGIATVHQELTLIGDLTVAENILLDRLPRRRGLRFLLDHRAAREAATRALATLGVPLDPRAKVSTLSFAEQQLVEIAPSIGRSPRVLLLDEPTSALSGTEVDTLLGLARKLAASGVAVVHVTHRLDELPRVADVVSVLRDGRLVGTIPAKDAEPRRLVGMMFGGADVGRRRRVRDTAPGREAGPGGEADPGREAAPESDPALVARDIAAPPRLHGVSLAVRPGEILGLAGLIGSGRTEMLESLFGVRPSSGEVRIAGERVVRRSPAGMAARGVVLVPEDRKRQGLALALSIADNAALPSLPLVTWRGLLTRARVRAAVAPGLRALGLVAPSLEHPASALSGGNQQKAVVGKWLLEKRRVLLLDEPTKGVDLGARLQLFDAVRRLADEGMAVIMVSSEFEELHEVCDRIVVLVRGRAVADVTPATTSLADLFALAMGAVA